VTVQDQVVSDKKLAITDLDSIENISTVYNEQIVI